ncbi:MAG: cytochrome c family protein [Lautropia sp.]
MTRLRCWLAAVGAALATNALQAAPDPVHGEQVYARCAACHALAHDRVGPRHCSLLGRRAGSLPGFPYSRAMRDSRITWEEQALDVFLSNPMKTVPGTTMTYDGVADAQDRSDLIAYLKRAGETPECRRSTPGRE